MKSSFSGLFMVLMMAAGCSAAPVLNLVENPGFETADFTGWTSLAFPSAKHQAVLDTTRPIPVHSGSFAAALGNNGVGDDGGGPTLPPDSNMQGTLSQTLATTIGQSYELSFFLAHEDSGFGPAGIPNDFSVNFGTVPLIGGGSPKLPLQNVGIFGYREYSFFVPGSSISTPSTVLTFTSREDPGGFYLDDVSVVEAVPELGLSASFTAVTLLLTMMLLFSDKRRSSTSPKISPHIGTGPSDKNGLGPKQ